MSAAKPYQILQLVRPSAGGIRTHVLQLIQNADAELFRHTVAGPLDFLHALPSELKQAAIPIDIAHRLTPIRDLRAANTLAAHLKLTPMLVHAHGLRAAWVAAFARYTQPFPFIFTAHNIIEAGRLEKLGLAVVFMHADKIIAVSPAVEQSLIASGAPKEKIVIIPNGVDIDYFAESHQEGEPPNIDTKADRFVVGCIARLSPEKGVDVLLEAAKLLPEVNFLIAGAGPKESQLKIDAPDNVRFLGALDDVRILLTSSDILAIPSRTEGQGIVALEAMASGIPIVASSIGGLATMLTDAENALLVSPNDSQALAAAISRLKNDSDLRQKLAANGLALVRERYDVRQTTKALDAQYLELLESTATAA